VIPYLGVGATYPWRNGMHNREIIFTLGGYVKRKLSKRLDITLDARHMFVNPRQNYVTKPGRFYEGMQTLSIGLSYKLGKHGFKRYVQVDESRMYHNSYEEYCSMKRYWEHVENGKDSLATLPHRGDLGNGDVGAGGGGKPMLPDTIIIREIDKKIVPLMLCFKINNAVLSKQELARMDYYMKHVEALIPDLRMKSFNIIGSADKATGNSTINQRLSEQRVEALRRVLIEKYGVPVSHITVDPQGDRQNVFKEASPNRAVYFKIEIK